MTAGFGLEKLGLITLKFPRVTLAIVAIAAAVLVYGGTKLGFSSDIREIFRSGSADFATLETVARQYPASDRDILIVAEGEDLFRPEALEALRTLHLELALVEGVGSTLSMFSARHPPDAAGDAQAVVPAEITPQTDVEALQRELQQHPLVSGRMLSRDGKLALLVVALTHDNGTERSVEQLRGLIGEIDAMAKDYLGSAGLDYTLTGTSVMRVEIIGALIRDQQRFRLLGLSIATLLCWIFFRNLRYVVLALAPAGLAITGLKGGMGLVGQEINVLTNVIPSLVMVIAFASALHILFAIRRKLGRHTRLYDAIRDAVIEVGPACVLTSATTTIALLSLAFVPHPFVRGFGLTAAVGTAFTYVAIMATVPPLALLLLKRAAPIEAGWGKADPIHRVVDAASNWSASLVREWPRAIALSGVLLAIAAGALYALNKPQYQYQDNLPEGNSALQAIETVNEKLSGTNTLRLLIQWPEGQKPSSDELLEVSREAHQVIASHPSIAGVSSLFSLEEWYTGGGRSRESLFDYLAKHKTPLLEQVRSAENNSALITGYMGNLPAPELLQLVEQLNAELNPLRQRYAPVRFSLTGLVLVSAHASTDMIGQLNKSLLAAVGFIIVLIGLSFRSAWAGVVSILPNVLPIFLAGAALYISGKGLQFTSVVAFTIGFGIAVDSTIHVLNRYRLATREEAQGEDAIALTIRAIGPVLIVSTLVLIAGIGGTILSELPMVRLYGQVIVLLLTTALLGDLLFLPAIIRVTQGWRKRAAEGASQPAASRPSPGEVE